MIRQYARMWGTLVALSLATMPGWAQEAHIQFVHASPDLSVETVDIHLNGVPMLEGLTYLGATPYLDVPGDQDIVLAVTRRGDPISEAVVVDTVNILTNAHWYAVFHGLTDTIGWPAIAGRDIGVRLDYGTGRTTSGSTTDVITRMFHAVTDMPDLDWWVEPNSRIRTNVEYGAFSGSNTARGSFWTGFGTEPGREWPRLTTVGVDFTPARGEAVLEVFTGLWSLVGGRRNGQVMLVRPDGSVQLEAILNQPVELQFISASLDPGFASADLWIDGFKVVEDGQFGTATDYFQVTGGTPVLVAVAPAGSVSPAEAFWSDSMVLPSLNDVQIVLTGYENPSSVENPFGYLLGAKLLILEDARAEWNGSGFGWRLVHVAPNLPAVDFFVGPGREYHLVDDLAFGVASDFQGGSAGAQYAPGWLTTYESHEVLGSWFVDYSTSAGRSFTSVITGREEDDIMLTFRDDGEAMLATAEDPETEVPALWKLDSNYPNPFNPVTRISFEVPYAAHVRLEVFDMLGRSMEILEDGLRAPGRHEVTWNAVDLPSGLYFYRLTGPGADITRTMVLLK